MTELSLKTYPDPCLRIKVRPVDEFNPDLADLLRSMADMMYLNQGIGLAAPQVGLGLSAIVVDIGEGLINFINPEILEKSSEKSQMGEGCLSLPGITVTLKRSETIKVRAKNQDGEIFVGKFEGLTARAIQHEHDHLQGRLIIDYLDPIRHFLSTIKLAGTRNRRNVKTCEVACHARGENPAGS